MDYVIWYCDWCKYKPAEVRHVCWELCKCGLKAHCGVPLTHLHNVDPTYSSQAPYISAPCILGTHTNTCKHTRTKNIHTQTQNKPLSASQETLIQRSDSYIFWSRVTMWWIFKQQAVKTLLYAALKSHGVTSLQVKQHQLISTFADMRDYKLGSSWFNLKRSINSSAQHALIFASAVKSILGAFQFILQYFENSACSLCYEKTFFMLLHEIHVIHIWKAVPRALLGSWLNNFHGPTKPPYIATLTRSFWEMWNF